MFDNGNMFVVKSEKLFRNIEISNLPFPFAVLYINLVLNDTLLCIIEVKSMNFSLTKPQTFRDVIYWFHIQQMV